MSKQKIILLTINLILLLSFIVIKVYSQEAPVPNASPQAQAPTTQTTPVPNKGKKGFFFFKRKELSEEQKQEKAKKLEIEKKQAELKKKVQEEATKQKYIARALLKEREKEIKKAKKAKKLIEIVSLEEDPVYISDASVLKTKSTYLKLKDVELKYKLELVNQTPKIINSVLVMWERKIPFTETLTIIKETKISKPLIPYEKRIVEYNDLDSKREGETYKVKISSVIFEDGTRWKSPSLSR